MPKRFGIRLTIWSAWAGIDSAQIIVAAVPGSIEPSIFPGNRIRSRGTKHGRTNGKLCDVTANELYRRARDFELHCRSNMTKEELIDAIRARAMSFLRFQKKIDA
jgi:hypothetical protein